MGEPYQRSRRPLIGALAGFPALPTRGRREANLRGHMRNRNPIISVATCWLALIPRLAYVNKNYASKNSHKPDARDDGSQTIIPAQLHSYTMQSNLL